MRGWPSGPTQLLCARVPWLSNELSQEDATPGPSTLTDDAADKEDAFDALHSVCKSRALPRRTLLLAANMTVTV